MKQFTNIAVRGLLTLTVAGLGLAVTPRAASADFLDFQVAEGTVPGAIGATTITADQVDGNYQEVIVLNPDGTFDASLFVGLTNYLNTEGTVNVPDYLGNTFPVQYLLYATVTAEGTYSGSGTPDDPLLFEPTDSNASVYVDPNSDTVPTNMNATVPGAVPLVSNSGEDYLIMTAGEINQALSHGTLVTTGPEDGQGGFYNLVFTDPTLTAAGQVYWFDLPLFGLVAVNDGDFDDADISDGTLTGQTSLIFHGPAVPEPATLSLFGLGLLGASVAARRRRKA